MNNTRKKLYIINGVTGPIGSPIFTYLAQKPDTLIYGISRQGLLYKDYLREGILPQNHLVFSLGDYLENVGKSIEDFIKCIPDNYEIIFVHSIGQFVTEIDINGNYLVESDFDGDGINDRVKRLSFEIPSLFAEKLAKTNRRVSFLQIASLSDTWNLKIHNSWVKSISSIKKNLKCLSNNYRNFNSVVLSVSSVLIPKELIDRPFVTTQTNAEIEYWLDPQKIAHYIYTFNDQDLPKYAEPTLFKKWPKFKEKHFCEMEYVKRRMQEMFKV